MLDWVVAAARAVPGVDKAVVATSTESVDDPIAEWCGAAGVACHRGPKEDVLRRFVLAGEAEGADHALRLTGDCPLLDPAVCGQVLALLRRSGADYATNAHPRSWPNGLDCEAVTMAALREADREARRPSERLHVTRFVRFNRDRYRVESLICPIPGLEGERWTLDNPEDLELLRRVARRLPGGRPASFLDVLAILDSEPEWRAINIRVARHVGTREALVDDVEDGSFWHRRHERGRVARAEADRVVAGASRRRGRPGGGALSCVDPVVTYGQDGHVWDVDGNEYVDLGVGTPAVPLGYANPAVDAAVRRGLAGGVSFSLPTRLEAILAAKLAEIVPCAEKSRFASAGRPAVMDAASAARRYTGRPTVLFVGRSEWAARRAGDAGDALVCRDAKGLAEALERVGSEAAAVVVDPVGPGIEAPDDLASIRDLAGRSGAALIFDETLTGFRLALGGAQEHFRVTPDMAVFAGSLANGLPISALSGRSDLLDALDPGWPVPFDGDSICLTAALATIEELERRPVVETLWRTGEAVRDGARARIAAAGLSHLIDFEGPAPLARLAFQGPPDADADTLAAALTDAMAGSGVLLGERQVPCFAHDEADIVAALGAYERVLQGLADDLAAGRPFDRPPVVEPVPASRGGRRPGGGP